MDLNTESDTFITKLNINNESIYLKVLWTDNSTEVFRLKLYEGERTWAGRFSAEFAEKYRECFDETKEEYVDNVKQCLEGDSDDFTYDFNIAADDEATFTWRKTFVNATRIHGTISLKLDSPEPKDNLIDFLLNENRELHQMVNDVNVRRNILMEEVDKCKHEMEKYVDIKTNLESVLYGKFVDILNSKKRRIQLLEENLEKFTKGKADD